MWGLAGKVTGCLPNSVGTHVHAQRSMPIVVAASGVKPVKLTGCCS